MKRYISSIISIALLAFLAGCTQKVRDPQAMKAAADKLDEQFLTDYNNQDADGLASLYWNSPEVVSFPNTKMMVTGWDSIKASFQKEFAGSRDFKLQLLEHHNQVEGDVVVGYGIWRYTLNIPNASPMVIEGRYSDVKTERDGKWVYIFDHISVPYTPPSPQK